MHQKSPAILKFAVVGLIATTTHVLIATRLLDVEGLHPSFANTAGFLVATVIGYALNTYWSFRSRNTSTILLRYLTVTSVGAGFCAVLSAIAHAAGFHPWFAIAATVAVLPLITYFLHRNWTYRADMISK